MLSSGRHYDMDRATRLRGESFTGIQRIPTQDRMANESMGEMLDYDAEHLKSTDLMISGNRCRVFAAAEPARREGYVPPGVDNPDLFNGARGGDYLVPEPLGLLDTYRTQMEQVGSGSTGVLAKWRSAGKAFDLYHSLRSPPAGGASQSETNISRLACGSCRRCNYVKNAPAPDQR